MRTVSEEVSTTQVEEPVESKPPKLARTRSVLSVLVGAIAVIGLLVTVFGVWVRGVLTDSERVGDAVERALSEPEVTDALSSYLTQQIFAAVDVSAALQEVLPDALDRLAGPIEFAARGRTQAALSDLLATEEARQVLGTVVERAHSAFVDLLQGEGLVDGITVEDGEVTVNMLPLLGRGFSTIQGLGLFESVEFPELARDGDPAAQIAELEAATGRDLPDDFGQLTVYSSDSLANAGEMLANAQRAVATARRALVLAAVITVVAFAGSILLARRRLRAAIALLLSSAAVLVIARVIVQRVVEQVPDLVSQPGAKAAVSSIIGSMEDGLRRFTGIIIVVALLVALGVFLAGPSPTAASVRRRAGDSGGGLAEVVRRHRTGTAIALGAALVLQFQLIGWSVVSVLICLALLLMIAGALWAPLGTPAPAAAGASGAGASGDRADTGGEAA